MKIRTCSATDHPNHQLPLKMDSNKKKWYEIVISSELADRTNTMDAVHFLRRHFDRLLRVNRRRWPGGWSVRFHVPVQVILERVWGYCDRGRIRMDPEDRAEIPWTLTHELGHHVHGNFWGVDSRHQKYRMEKRIALWRTWLIESKKFKDVCRHPGHIANHIKYFTAAFSGNGFVVGCRSTNPSRILVMNRVERQRQTNSKSGFNEFLAEAFSIVENARLQKNSKHQKHHNRFLRVFPKTMRRYWKMFHGSPFPAKLLKIKGDA